MKNSVRFLVAAVALGFFASANAAVLLQTNTKISKKHVLVQYRMEPTGVLHTMTIKHKRLSKWCIKRGGCRINTPPGRDNGGISVIAGVVDTGGDGENVPTVIVPTETVPDREVVEVPEPTTLALLGAGLLGMGLSARRRKVAAA